MTTSTGSGTWTEPGAFEVAPGVHRVPLPLPDDGLRAINVYILTTPDGLVLIDAGWAIPEARTLLEQALAELGATPADITRFLVTHVHRDHYTQAVTVRRDFGTPIFLGRGERPTMESVQRPGVGVLSSQIAALRRHGADVVAAELVAHVGDSTVDPSEWELPDSWLSPGPIVVGPRTLEAVETPGHTAGHLVFHDVEGALLFAGDHVLPTITPSIGFEQVTVADPLGAFLHSLAVVRSRPDALLLPAHGPVAPSVHARVDELLLHHEERLARTAEAVAAGAHTPYAVAQRLGWTRRLRRFSELDTFNAMLATFETGAHLVLLTAQGHLSRTEVDGVDHYTSAL